MKRIGLLAALLLLPASGAGLTFAETAKEVHARPDQRTVTVDFGFKNETDAEVAIVNSSSSCSCMHIQVKGGKMRYAPGEEGVIRGVFDMGNFSGEADKAMQVWLEGDPEEKPSVNLRVKVHIPVLIDVQPKTVRWDLGGEPEPRVISVTMNHVEPIRVKQVTCSNSSFTAELRRVEEGRKYEIVVTPASTDQQGLGVVTIETDCRIERQATQRAFTVIRRPTP